jgi:hypothetical protein
LAAYADPREVRSCPTNLPCGSAPGAHSTDDCRWAWRLLAERTGREDGDGYRHWLESIAARVCHAGRTGGLFGVGGQPVTQAERQFLIELAAVYDR